MILKLYLLSVICCLIIDISGFLTSIKTFISKTGRIYHIPFLYNIDAHNIRLKPFDCSLCMSFWSGIVFLYAHNAITIDSTAACLFIACAARYTTGAINTFYGLIDRLLDVINSKYILTK